MSPSEINGRAPSIDLARPAISPRNLLRSGTPTAHERVALPLLPSGPGGVRRFSLRGAQPSTPPREAHSTRRSLERGFNPAVADCGLQGTATSPSSTATLYVPNGGEGGIRTHGTGVTRARHFQCRTFGRSVTSPHRFRLPGLRPAPLSSGSSGRGRRPPRPPAPPPASLAEGRGFEPPRDLLGPYPISSRTPSTGLGHPSASTLAALRFKELCDERPAFLAQHAALDPRPMVHAGIVEQPVERGGAAGLRIRRPG